ncbi:hypothetical protein [Alishewanella phage vB_AspM_Slicko01]|nr:hypothetical protein [Alishewanella phage vB_AspM_Slicko01]
MYTLNISKNGQHYFATAERSIDSAKKAQKIRDELQKIYSESEGFKITCSYVQTVHKAVELPPTITPDPCVKFATKRLLESVWTLGYKIVNDRVEIISYNRENDYGYENESVLPKMQIIENDMRIAVGVTIDGTDYVVSNPQHVFSYPK